ncbi:MAG: hypothetical protein CL627_04765 [Aurantimonas sp.]|nr:hypothetical protein [Aurantimonas sp.]
MKPTTAVSTIARFSRSRAAMAWVFISTVLRIDSSRRAWEYKSAPNSTVSSMPPTRISVASLLATLASKSGVLCQETVHCCPMTGSTFFTR